MDFCSLVMEPVADVAPLHAEVAEEAAAAVALRALPGICCSLSSILEEPNRTFPPVFATPF